MPEGTRWVISVEIYGEPGACKLYSCRRNGTRKKVQEKQGAITSPLTPKKEVTPSTLTSFPHWVTLRSRAPLAGGDWVLKNGLWTCRNGNSMSQVPSLYVWSGKDQTHTWRQSYYKRSGRKYLPLLPDCLVAALHQCPQYCGKVSDIRLSNRTLIIRLTTPGHDTTIQWWQDLHRFSMASTQPTLKGWQGFVQGWNIRQHWVGIHGHEITRRIQRWLHRLIVWGSMAANTYVHPLSTDIGFGRVP